MTNNHHNRPTLHWRFPQAAKFGRVIPKETLYRQAGVNTQLKRLFVEQVGQIKWAYKLAETTINLAKTHQVDEIEVIRIQLKTGVLNEQVLAAIDKAIPHPTLFVLLRDQLHNQPDEQQGETEMAYMAAHKQKLSANKTKASNKESSKKNTKEKWQQSQYLQSAWLKADSIPARPLPTATHLQGLYEQLLEALLPPNNRKVTPKANGNDASPKPNQTYENSATRSTQTIDEKLANLAAIDSLTKQLNRVKTKRDKEKQFNRRLQLNHQFKALKQQLAKLHTG